MFTYLLINLATIAGPMARSFEPRIAFYRKWKAVFAAIGITMSFFILWDALFTFWGIWGFNPRYLIGFHIFGLPIEEWLFFITVPYACIFIYEVLNFFMTRDWLAPAATMICLGMVILGIVMALNFIGNAYTFSAFGLMAILCSVQIYIFKSPWMSRFLMAYIVSLIPFFIVNGLLTGSWIEEMVVWYNDDENLMIRFGTIPIEDFIYGFDLLLINVWLYEYFKKRWEIY